MPSIHERALAMAVSSASRFSGFIGAVAVKPEGDKVMRLHAQTATIENGFVHLPREAHWLAGYLHELTVFPSGRHDDQVGSTSQALASTKLRPPGWAIREIYRQEFEKARIRSG
jgi:predicted phage terminase large subunit-like protein